MKTTSRLYDIIYSNYNNLFGDFLRSHQIVYFNRQQQFTAKVITYDPEIKTVCRDTIFYGLDFLSEEVRSKFEAEFIARFMSRTIKFQTWEVLNWKLVAFCRGCADIITDYYTNGAKYLKGTQSSTSTTIDMNTSQSINRSNSINVDLPQDQTNVSLDQDTFEYANDTSHSKSRNQDTSNGESSTTSENENFDIQRLSELQAYHDALFKDLDKQLFSQLR